MSAVEAALAQIEAILAEVERLHQESGGQFRQSSDIEALHLACRIERRMANQFGKHNG